MNVGFISPLRAGVAVLGKPITTPDGARTTPGWPTPTGPSRPVVSASLPLLAYSIRELHASSISLNTCDM